MPVLCCWRVWYLGLVPIVTAHPVIVRPGPAQLQQELVQPHHAGFGLSSHQRGGGCVPLSQQRCPGKIQCGARKEVGTTARYIGHVPAASTGTARRRRWEMVKALIVARGFVVLNFLPHKKKPKNKKKISKNHPGRWRAGLAAACVLWLQAACTRVAPLLQTKTHHKTQEFKSLWTEKLNVPSLGAADLPAPGDQPIPSCFTIEEKPQKNKRKP